MKILTPHPFLPWKIWSAVLRTYGVCGSHWSVWIQPNLFATYLWVSALRYQLLEATVVNSHFCVDKYCSIDKYMYGNIDKPIGESNTVLSANTMYRPLQQYCSHLSKYGSIDKYGCLDPQSQITIYSFCISTKKSVKASAFRQAFK